MNTFISVSLLLAIVGATWRMSGLLTEIKLTLQKLRHLPAQVDHIEKHMMMSEEDMNNLFGAYRASGDPARMQEFVRRTRYVPYKKPEEP